LLLAVGGMLGGAALIGGWCVGLMLIVGSAAVGVDALLRDTDTAVGRRVSSTHEDVIERFRRAR
jgi:hypothetical protein